MDIVAQGLKEHRATVEALSAQAEEIAMLGAWWKETLAGGHTIFFCGNGGSAADAQHLAAELVGRYRAEREALPGVALTVDTSILTAVANDYSYARVFARQVEALGRAGDLLVAISTSGNSPNVVAAAQAAQEKGMRVIGMTGASECELDRWATHVLHIPATVTARVQEMHLMVGHIWCAMVDDGYAG